MKALIVVDVQNDFCSDGALAVNDGELIIDTVNELVRRFELEDMPIIFTRDWHPANHISFRDYGGIWPVHCVAGTKGAEIHQNIYFPSVSILVSKASLPESEAYSGFQGTGLASTLHDLGVEHLVVAGLATDYCVKNTVIDALTLGFSVDVVLEGVRAVNVNPNDGQVALDEMQTRGARMLHFSDLSVNL
ncbi:MAG: bifunctional nicotinamidase/pyrazinamidase [Bacteroidales bacterium]